MLSLHAHHSVDGLHDAVAKILTSGLGPDSVTYLERIYGPVDDLTVYAYS